MNHNTTPDTIELFRISIDETHFIALVKQFQREGFDFNGLCRNGDKHWPIGKVAVLHGDKAVEALADAGYRFDHDDMALQFAKKAFYGSRQRATFLAAHRHNRWIDVPSIEWDTFAKAQEILAPCFRGLDVAFQEKPQKPSILVHEMKSDNPARLIIRIFCEPH